MILKNDSYVNQQIENLLNQDSNGTVTVTDYNWNHSVKKLVVKEVGEEAFEFIDEHVTYASQDIFLTATTTLFNVEKINDNRYKSIVNLKRVNNFVRINTYFEAVNAKLPVGGIFINKVEIRKIRKKRILKKFAKPFNYLYYYTDLLFTGISAKLHLNKKIYAHLIRSKGRVLTKAETFGRLYSCGFEILEEKTIKDELYFVARKLQQPAFNPDPVRR